MGRADAGAAWLQMVQNEHLRWHGGALHTRPAWNIPNASTRRGTSRLKTAGVSVRCEVENRTGCPIQLVPNLGIRISASNNLEQENP